MRGVKFCSELVGVLLISSCLACGPSSDGKGGSIVVRPGQDGGELDGEVGEDATVTDADAALEDASAPDAIIDADVPSCARVRIELPAGQVLNVRPTPATDGVPVGTLYDGFVVEMVERTEGEAVQGNTEWFLVQSVQARGYVSAVFATCTTSGIRDLDAPDGFYLPFECGHETSVTQGNNGPRHTGLFAYALDFRVTLGLPMTAIADGFVLRVYDETEPGSACDQGGESCSQYANYVLLLHGDGSTSTYRHLLEAKVAEGDFVPRGSVIGLAGQSGWATGPHSHFQRMENCEKSFQPEGYGCQSIPTKFADVPGDGLPDNGQALTSGNCP